ncbi:krox-like protein, putative [Plasmodium malariae]|uniref:Krox-like protein, putative n=1 Tax=Plasmodium malariae TaxID=5858 RepID=A0A1A8W9B9_PLAMA|nr:krox-like protein, putative [Plasmodium malariae]
MGEGHSKHTLNYGNLREEDVEMIRKKFNLNKKEANEKISTLDFIYVYPYILRPYIALVLPSFHEVLRKKCRHKETKSNHYGFNYALNVLFNKSSKKVNNEISLQDIINILSYINSVKSRILIKILFMSFLRYSISHGSNPNNANVNSGNMNGGREIYCNLNDGNPNDGNLSDSNPSDSNPNYANLNDGNPNDDCPNNTLTKFKLEEENEGNTENLSTMERTKGSDKKEDIHASFLNCNDNNSNDNNVNNIYSNNNYGNNGDNDRGNKYNNNINTTSEDEDELGRNRNSFKFVFSDSNVNVINKNKKKERNYKFIKDNIFFLEKNILKNQYPKNYIMKDLISVEEALHHLFTYMYIEQLYLLYPNNILFKLANKSQIPEKNNIPLKKYSTSPYDVTNLNNRKNSWDLAYFFNELFCSLETNLDFRNIIMGFRLFVNSIDNNKNTIYSLVVEYINTTFISLCSNYSNATLKHFMNCENIITEEKKKKKKKSNSGISNSNNNNNSSNGKSYINTGEENRSEEENGLENINDLCMNSIDLIHTIYTNMKMNEIKKQENKNNPKKIEEKYEKSSSIVEIQNSSSGWRGLFLNKTSKVLTDEVVFTLRQCSPCFMNNEWYRLYASWKEGTSFNRFMSCLFYYEAPIIIVIKTSDNQILGAVCTTALKDSHLFHGSSNDFLFSASPVFRIIRTNQFGTNYVYLNSKNSFYPKGLGFGGRTECFRLFLSDEFKDSYCTQSDYTYKSGHLYFPHYERDNNKVKEHKNKNNSNDNQYIHYEENDDDEGDEDTFLYKLSINEVEAWGCGDEKALEQQRLMQQNEEACKQERRSTDKSKIVQNSFDKEFLLPKVFVGGKYEKLTQDK